MFQNRLKWLLGDTANSRIPLVHNLVSNMNFGKMKIEDFLEYENKKHYTIERY